MVLALSAGFLFGAALNAQIAPQGIDAVRVEKQLRGKLGRLVIMLTGTDSVQTRYLEEALALQLLKLNVGVVSRLRVERLLAEEMIKNRAVGDKDPRKAIHATSIAKSAGATAIVIGTLHVEPRQALATPAQPSPPARVVRCVSLQLVSADTEEILWTTCQELDESVSYSDMAQQLVLPLLKE